MNIFQGLQTQAPYSNSIFTQKGQVMGIALAYPGKVAHLEITQITNQPRPTWRVLVLTFATKRFQSEIGGRIRPRCWNKFRSSQAFNLIWNFCRPKPRVANRSSSKGLLQNIIHRSSAPSHLKLLCQLNYYSLHISLFLGQATNVQVGKLV